MDDPVEITRRDATVTPGQANVLSLLIGVPLVVLAYALFQLCWGYAAIEGLFGWIRLHGLLTAVIILVGILAHEALHIAGWIVLGKLTLRDIALGFNVKALMPYAHVKNPLRVNIYRWGAALPGLILGVVPLLVGLITGSGPWFIFGLAFLLAALGDAVILWLLRKEKPAVWVEDHPTAPGCVILEEKVP